jgi:lipocalin-like protein
MRGIKSMLAIVAGLGISSVEAAAAQSAADLVGTWLPVSAVHTRPDGATIEMFGPDPKGILIFQGDGHFAFILNRADLPGFAAHNPNAGTAEEYKSVVQGSFAYFGTYTVTNNTVVMHVGGGTWPDWYGTDHERLIISFSGSELKWIDPTPSVGGKIENVWKRAK